MTRVRLFILASLASVAGAALWFATREPSPPAAVTTARPLDAAPALAPAAPTPTDLSTNQPPAMTSAVVTLARPPDPMAVNFAATDDLLAFIEGIQAAAQDGDGLAAYYMYRALERCQTEYGNRFGGGRRERPLDEVLIDDDVVRRFGVADLRRIHGQCQRLRESDMTQIGPADDWLLKAADAGYPRAQAELAVWYMQNGGPPPHAEWREPALELARAALRSKDPDVFLPVSRVIEGLSGQQAPGVPPAASWYLAACLRGLDCGPSAEITRQMCSADPACRPDESALDLIRRNSGERYAATERGAREINDAIDAGRLDELGL